MPRLAALGTALPPHVLDQAEARRLAERIYARREDLARLVAVFARSGVEQRHFAFPPEYYLADRGFEERNRDFVEQGAALSAQAVESCLRQAGARPDQIDHVFLATTTGLATPSLDSLLVSRLGLRRDVRRSPLFGLGCAGGAAALARAADHVRAYPGHRALAVSVELCGQVFSLASLDRVDVVGAALFGDGAACALVAGDDVPARGPAIAASRSVLFEGTRGLMGWRFTADGMRLVLSEEVPAVVHGPLKKAIQEFAAAPVHHWVLHPGGRRILDAYKEALGLADRDLEWTRGSLARVGNLSSASVLFVLGDLLASGRPRPGERGLVCALGPGFATEMVLLQW
jgi:alkylresorcinol/alkylpyrone synthase